MSLSKLTSVALEIDGANRNVKDSDLIEANKRFNTSPSNSVDNEQQWTYKDAYIGLLTAKAITNHRKEFIEGATTYTYSNFPETLSANSWFGGQDIRAIDYNNLDKRRILNFYDVIGRVNQNRSFDARDLILNNKTWIASAPSVTDSGSPVSGYSKCTRDIEFLLEAIAYNISNGGNNRVYDYSFISREALLEQANKESRTITDIKADYEVAINGTSDGSATDEGVRDRLESVINGSADPDENGTSLLEESDITEASDNCIDMVKTAHTYLDLILDLIEKGTNSVARRSNPYGDQEIGMGRLHDAGKLILNQDPAIYDDSSGNVGIKGWITTPPSISDTSLFDSSKCPRDLGYFLDAIAQNLVRSGNYRVHSYAQMSRTALQDQAAKSSESRTYQEIVKDYELAINGDENNEGVRHRLQQAVQGTAIINNSPIEISNFDITPASDRCSDVVSAINVFLDIILLILKEGPQAVPQTPSTESEVETLFSVPDNRQNQNSVYQKPPYSFNKKQISKCIRDVEYYVRYLTYGMVANDFGILDDLFLNGLVEVNKAFDLNTNWYKEALNWMKMELNDNGSYYFSENETTIELPSDSSKTFSITVQDQIDKAKEFIDYMISRI